MIYPQKLNSKDSEILLKIFSVKRNTNIATHVLLKMRNISYKNIKEAIIRKFHM